MRAYRAKRKAARFTAADDPAELAGLRTFAIESAEEIGRLQEEIRHLKAELAKRPLGTIISPAEATHLARKAQQAERDRILRGINRTK